MFFKNLLVALTIVSAVRSHGTITNVAGANGVQGAGFGIIADTPRDGSRPNPFEQDTSIIRDREIQSGKTGVCGRTPAGGNNDVAAQLAAASQAGLPSTSSDGALTMTLHQVNQDGAGPFECDVSGDGGNTFQAAQVTKNVPGFLSLSLATAQDFPLVATTPAGMACTAGPDGNACIMRCRNKALAGPFGSCVAYTTDAGAAAGGNGTAAATSNAAQADTAASGSTAKAAAAGGAKSGRLGKLFGGLFGREEKVASKKRYINSRVAGARSGFWM